MIYFGCVSSRILWIKFKFSIVKVCVVVGYSPSERDDEERGRFWDDMDKALYSLGNGYRLCILGDINLWIEDTERAWCF